jgi:hypothetical protein
MKKLESRAEILKKRQTWRFFKGNVLYSYKKTRDVIVPG